MDAPLHGTAPLLDGETTLVFFELTNGLHLLLLGSPLQLNFDMESTIGLYVALKKNKQKFQII